MSLPLFEVEHDLFARQAGASPGKQIVLVLDRAGWHASAGLRVPEHLHLLSLPAYSPELQPAEHLWPLTNTTLANRRCATTLGPRRGPGGALCGPPRAPSPYSLHDAVPVVAAVHQEMTRTEAQ